MDALGTFTGLSPIGGASTEAPAMAVFMDHLYMAAKGTSNNKIYVRDQDHTGRWSPWGTIFESTNKSQPWRHSMTGSIWRLKGRRTIISISVPWILRGLGIPGL